MIGNFVNDAGTSNTITLSGTSFGNSAYTIVSDYNNIEAKFKDEYKEGKRIGPRLYFKYVKSKLNKVEKKRLGERLGKLQKMMLVAKDNEQQALYETLMEKIIILIKESELVSVGCDSFVTRDVVHKYLHLVKVPGEDLSCKLKNLEEFPRLIPRNIQSKIKTLKTKKIFDHFEVLYIQYDGEKEIKTNKRKIREKDPILFGVLKDDENKLYYVADWVDEYCDLTLDKFVKQMKEKDIGELIEIPEMTDKYIQSLKKEVMERRERLKKTDQSNYRRLMVEEDEQKLGKFQKFIKKIFKL